MGISVEDLRKQIEFCKDMSLVGNRKTFGANDTAERGLDKRRSSEHDSWVEKEARKQNWRQRQVDAVLLI